MSDEPKVLLTLENGDIIVCKRFGYLGDNLIGAIADCDDGSQRLFAVDAEPTNAQFYDFKFSAMQATRRNSKPSNRYWRKSRIAASKCPIRARSN